MPSSASRPAEPAPPGVKGQLNQFWQRVTDGLELNQLWTQFHTDARASYRLYQRDYGARRRRRPSRAVSSTRCWNFSGPSWKN